jgi:hypothetical protein
MYRLALALKILATTPAQDLFFVWGKPRGSPEAVAHWAICQQLIALLRTAERLVFVSRVLPGGGGIDYLRLAWTFRDWIQRALHKRLSLSPSPIN